LGAGTG
ncbi:unnamed protein product, partial [Didymodactylos carnosus]